MGNRDLIELIILCIIALFVAIYFIIKAIKNHWIEKITLVINESIKYAELNIKEGPAKKRYVLEQVELKCEELGIPYTFISKLVGKIIDKVISDYNILKK